MISWDERIYAALSRFHAGKGFNPYSQDVARNLKHPLYEIRCGPRGETACGEQIRFLTLAQRNDLMMTVEGVFSEHNDDNGDLPPYHAPRPQEFRFMIIGVLGLFMTLAPWAVSLFTLRVREHP